MRQVARYTAVILLTLCSIILAWQFRSVLLLFVLSLIVAAAVRPIIGTFVNKGVPATVAQIIVYLVVLLGLGGGIYLISAPLSIEVGQLSNWLIMEYERITAMMLSTDGWQQTLASRLLAPNDLYTAVFGNNAQLFFETTLGVAQGVVGLLVGFIFVLVLSIYWSIDQGHFERLWLSILSVEHRVPARNGWRAMEKEIGRFVRVEFILFLMTLCLLGVGYQLIGVRYPILLAILGGLAWLLPVVGVILIAIPAYWIGSLMGTAVGILTLIYTLIVFAFLNFYLQSRLHDRSRYSSITLLLIMIPLVDTLGLLGFLIAPPIAIAIQLIFAGVVRYYTQVEKTAVQLSKIEDRFETIKETNTEQLYPPELENILQRLDTLITKAQQLTPADSPQTQLADSQ